MSPCCGQGSVSKGQQCPVKEIEGKAESMRLLCALDLQGEKQEVENLRFKFGCIPLFDCTCFNLVIKFMEEFNNMCLPNKCTIKTYFVADSMTQILRCCFLSN